MSFFSELRRRNVIRVAVAYSVTGWLVAQVAELALDSFGAPDWVMKTLLLFLVMGLPFALIFAWAYELTPEGIKREEDVDRSSSITQQTGQRLNYAIIAVLSLALVLTLGTREWGSATPAVQSTAAEESGETSIAVLPFVNMSDDIEQEYFSDGISEELLNVLVRVDGLRVASRTSSFSFKDKDTPIPEIAAALGVEHVLEGSVRKSGDTIRITAQLIDVKTDSHLWSDTYDRKFEDIFVIQDEISAHIVDALKVALGAGEAVQTPAHPTENLAAYEAYLRGRHLWQQRGEKNIMQAIELFTAATEKDPKFARAWASLGAAHMTMPAYAIENIDVKEHQDKALEFSQRALELDPGLSDPHAVIADLLRYDRRWSEAEQHYLRAIELDPGNSTAHLWYTEQLGATGRAHLALVPLEQSLRLDPFNPGVNSQASYVYEVLGESDKSERYLEISRELGHPRAYFFLIDAAIDRGDLEEAERMVIAGADELRDDETAGYLALIAAVRDPNAIQDYVADASQYFDAPPAWFAVDHVRFGRVSDAMDILISSPPNGGGWMRIWLSAAQPIRQHERFGELVRAAGLDDFWDEVGWPPQCSRDGETITCD